MVELIMDDQKRSLIFQASGYCDYKVHKYSLVVFLSALYIDIH